MSGDQKRFLDKIRIVESGCHEWQSTRHTGGYGKFWFKGRICTAHRVAWQLFVGEIPAGMHVLHKCDNRKCVNPEHLYVGTAKDNVRDKIERCPWYGRMKIPFETVQEAIKLYEIGFSQQQVANRLGIKQVQVSRYVRGVQRKTK